MPNGYLKRRAERYARYTGVSYQAAVRRMTALVPGERPIPEATGAQRLLEGRLFTYLRGDVAYFAHPVGIDSVSPGASGITVTLDSSVTCHGHPLVRHAVEGLLPYSPPEEERLHEPLGGVRGIRVVGVSRNALRLGLVGTSARVTVRSTGSSTDWREVVAWRASVLQEHGCRPCWNEPRITPAEAAYEREHRALLQDEDNAAWLPSGLLRRVGLLHTVSTAFSTRYWLMVDKWKFELCHEWRVPPPHDEFIGHLINDRWGLPLALTHGHCDCDPKWAYPNYDKQCTFELSHRGTRPGELQLRFRTIRARYPTSSTYRDLQRANAALNWLARVLPRASREEARRDDGAVRQAMPPRTPDISNLTRRRG